jgi:hypothetical protein
LRTLNQPEANFFGMIETGREKDPADGKEDWRCFSSST